MATCFAQGSSFAQLGLEHQGSAVLDGWDTATLIASLNIGVEDTQFDGSSSAQLTVQEPFQGSSSAMLFGEVYHKPVPLRVELFEKPAVLYGHKLQPQDLTFESDDPLYMVRYSLSFKDRGGVYRPIGPSMRTPSENGAGRYFVSGLAGDGGQPGPWCVTWYYQASFYSPVQQLQVEFLVLESSCLARQAYCGRAGV